MSQSAFAIDFSDRDFTNLNTVRWKVNSYKYDFEDKKGTKEAEDAFLEFLDFYSDFIDFQNKRFVLSDDPLDEYSYESQNKRLDDFYGYYGLKVKLGDCQIFYFTYNCKYIYENFAPYLTKDWQELLEFEQYGDKILFFDYRYLNSKDELKQILKFYENFYKKYPNFSQKDMIKAKIKHFRKDLKNYPNI